MAAPGARVGDPGADGRSGHLDAAGQARPDHGRGEDDRRCGPSDVSNGTAARRNRRRLGRLRGSGRPRRLGTWLVPLPPGPLGPVPASATARRAAMSSSGSWASRLTPASAIRAVFSRPCPAMGRKLTTGKPARIASREVSPPAFSTRASQAAMSAGMSSVHPRMTELPAAPAARAATSARSRSSRPHTTTGVKRLCGDRSPGGLHATDAPRAGHHEHGRVGWTEAQRRPRRLPGRKGRGIEGLGEPPARRPRPAGRCDGRP